MHLIVIATLNTQAIKPFIQHSIKIIARTFTYVPTINNCINIDMIVFGYVSSMYRSTINTFINTGISNQYWS